jgi:hypothetical protein
MWLVAPPGQVSRQLTFGETFMKYFALGRINYDWHRFDFDKDPARDLRRLLDADDRDLSAFHGVGGTLLMYFGRADTALPPLMGSTRRCWPQTAPQRCNSCACLWCLACFIAGAASGPLGSMPGPR